MPNHPPLSWGRHWQRQTCDRVNSICWYHESILDKQGGNRVLLNHTILHLHFQNIFKNQNCYCVYLLVNLMIPVEWEWQTDRCIVDWHCLEIGIELLSPLWRRFAFMNFEHLIYKKNTHFRDISKSNQVARIVGKAQDHRKIKSMSQRIFNTIDLLTYSSWHLSVARKSFPRDISIIGVANINYGFTQTPQSHNHWITVCYYTCQIDHHTTHDKF